jgi:hypothetical protein
MGPYYSTKDEIEARLRRDAIHDAKIEAAKREVDRLQKEINSLSPVERSLPEAGCLWVQQQLNSNEKLQALEEAEIDYQWTLYDKKNHRRPLYPRKRAISPSNKLFEPRKQAYHPTQEQSLLFKLLPPELRAEIYRAVFGSLIIEIDAAHAGFNGPPPSQAYRILFGSSIVKTTGEQFIKGKTYYNKRDPIKWTPHIIPLLQTCRQMYVHPALTHAQELT